MEGGRNQPGHLRRLCGPSWNAGSGSKSRRAVRSCLTTPGKAKMSIAAGPVGGGLWRVGWRDG